MKNWEKGLKKIKFDAFKKLKEFNPDIVIAYEYSTITSLILMSICKIKRIPYLINCDGAIPSKNILKTMIKTHYVRNAEGYFANGQSAKKYFLQYKGKEEKVIPYKFSNYYEKDILKKPFSEKEKKEKKEKLNISAKKVFLTVGRFEYLKGFDLLFEIAKKMKKNKDVLFIIIGGGPLEEEFKQIKEKEKIDNILILPYMSKEKLIEYYDASDAFIFPTRRDIWGLVVGEAMSRGLLVVSTDSSMAGKELIKNEVNGYVVENENIDQLEESINKIIKLNKDAIYMMGEKSIETIKEYNIEKMSEDHYNALKKIYNKKQEIK